MFWVPRGNALLVFRADHVGLSSITLIHLDHAESRHLSKLVYVSGGQKPSFREGNVIPEAAQTCQNNGYGQSKYVSELLVERCVDLAAFHGKRLCTVKPGYIIGSLKTGIANQSDFIWRLIAGCLKVKAYNKDEARHWLFVSDVGSVARAVVSGVFDLHESGDKRQVVDGLLFSDLWSLLQKTFGYELEPLPHAEWLPRLQDAILVEQESHPLFPLVNTLEKEGGSIGSEEAPTTRTDWVIDVVERNVQQLIEVGFLPAPPRLHAHLPFLRNEYVGVVQAVNLFLDNTLREPLFAQFKAKVSKLRSPAERPV